MFRQLVWHVSSLLLNSNSSTSTPGATAAGSFTLKQGPSSTERRKRLSIMNDLTLKITPPSLEARFWSRRCSSRLNSLDALFEICNALIWLTILPMLQEGPDRAFAKACLLLGLLQLAAIQLTPRLWIRSRSVLLSSALLLRCVLLLVQATRAGSSGSYTAAGQQQPPSPPQQHHYHSAAVSAGPETDLATSMTVVAGLWGNLLFVLFHQQPVRIQLPLLAATSLLQAFSVSHAGWSSSSSSRHPAISMFAYSSNSSSGYMDQHLSSSSSPSTSSSGAGAAGNSGSSFGWWQQQQASDAELLGISEALKWGFGLLATGGINPGSSLWQLAGPQREACLLATRLFAHAFGGFLLPVFVAYVVEWKSKVSFLLTACNLPQQQQLQVLTPAAAIVRASLLLAMLLYLGWLLLLATCTWLVCCGIASVLLA